MIKYISFDLDGTLADDKFDSLIWCEEIPRLYAKKKNLTLKAAKQYVFATYFEAKYIENVPRWTDIAYWFSRFGLKDYNALINDMKKHICVYPDTVKTLEYLSKKYKLIVVSAAERKFLNAKLEAEGLSKYFCKVYSSTSDFNSQKKTEEMYSKILKKLKVKPEEVVHIGDDLLGDYEAPTKVGIKAYHLVRSNKMKSQHTIHSLRELRKIL